MTIPVTTRLDESTVAALDEVVAGGLAPNRAAVVSEAVQQWLARHSDEAIAASYRRRYTLADTESDELMARLGAFSAAACLATSAD